MCARGLKREGTNDCRDYKTSNNRTTADGGRLGNLTTKHATESCNDREQHESGRVRGECVAFVRQQARGGNSRTDAGRVGPDEMSGPANVDESTRSMRERGTEDVSISGRTNHEIHSTATRTGYVSTRQPQRQLGGSQVALTMDWGGIKARTQVASATNGQRQR